MIYSKNEIMEIFSRSEEQIDYILEEYEEKSRQVETGINTFRKGIKNGTNADFSVLNFSIASDLTNMDGVVRPMLTQYILDIKEMQSISEQTGDEELDSLSEKKWEKFSSYKERYSNLRERCECIIRASLKNAEILLMLVKQCDN